MPVDNGEDIIARYKREVVGESDDFGDDGGEVIDVTPALEERLRKRLPISKINHVGSIHDSLIEQGRLSYDLIKNTVPKLKAKLEKLLESDDPELVIKASRELKSLLSVVSPKTSLQAIKYSSDKKDKDNKEEEKTVKEVLDHPDFKEFMKNKLTHGVSNGS